MSKKHARLDLPAIAAIGSEFGWPPRLLEMAVANAIRLAYLDRAMTAEADVNLALGTIAVRRRNGGGPKGHWVDIDDPLMPTRPQLIHTMELMQYGDGAPGRVVEGEVCGYQGGGVIYKLREGRQVLVPENLLSVVDSFHKPECGSKQILSLIASTDDVSGLRQATRRGREFVASVIEEFYPDCVSGVWTGASNSWAVIRMKPEHVSAWLEKGGVNLKHMQTIMGLKRITLLPEGRGNTAEEAFENELKHFVNNAWKACVIREVTPTLIRIYTPLDDQNPKKIRTFTSMLKKIIPDREISVR
ncbi:MAG: hypothetical protein H6922_05775 [Pseudomonadaceae bacterium]|nr:hypothetical protein [Pseudomonadaceae bacterium]